MSPDFDMASAGPDDPTGRRACDQCRLRKIRCDKDWPCSNCRVSKRSCTSTGAGQRPKEPRQRVLISSQYERKIDQIEARLGSIEGLLQSISSAASNDSSTGSSAPRRSHTPQTGGTSSAPTTASIADLDSSDNESGYGGDSGLAAQTAFASEFLEHAVQRTSLREVNPSIESALSNLRQLVDMQHHRSISHGPRFPLQIPVPPGGLSQLPMPPMATVVPLLKKSKNSPPTLFTFTPNLVGITDISSLCRMVYFPADDFSQANFIIVNSLLFNLFLEEYSHTRDAELMKEYKAYERMLQVNLETALANLPLFLSPKIENVQALILGVLYAIDVSRPSVAWHLSAMAAQLCQTGGFHRLECVNSDPPKVAQIKTIVFWQTYTLDKALSLRIGRASVIRDFDINIPRNFNFKGFPHLEESPFPQLWVTTSAIQGRIYDELYSPSALAGPPSELVERARALAVECKDHEEEYYKAREETSAYLKALDSSEAFDVFLKGDEIQFQVTLTLVYRAIPAPVGSVSKFCAECLESARRAIALHQEAIEMLHRLGHYDTAIHMHWSLLGTPFAPFFVMFCYIIETSSQEDLTLVGEFVARLKSYSDASETIDKLCRLFQVMLDVAVVYLEAKSQQQQDQTMIPIGDEFDMYLSQLGFMHTDGRTMEPGDLAAPSQAVGQANHMADWFSGSRNMFGLLEEDLSQIDPSRWMAHDQL